MEDILKKAFAEEDKTKLVELLNFISDKAKFEVDTKEVIKFYGLLSWSQQVLLKKINDHIAGPPKVVEPEPEIKPSKKKK